MIMARSKAKTCYDEIDIMDGGIDTNCDVKRDGRRKIKMAEEIFYIKIVKFEKN